MNSAEFILKAQEGGWKPRQAMLAWRFDDPMTAMRSIDLQYQGLFFTPEVWEAVGTAIGWIEGEWKSRLTGLVVAVIHGVENKVPFGDALEDYLKHL